MAITSQCIDLREKQLHTSPDSVINYLSYGTWHNISRLVGCSGLTVCGWRITNDWLV